MLETKSWPESWRERWVVPIYEKKAFLAPSNKRGIHLTAQLSKVAERPLLPLIEPHISRTVAFGPNQFAYTKCRGAREALTYLTMSWLLALNRRKKVAVCCSDVSGAFDRVRAEPLLEKLRCKGVHPTMVALTESWLQQRTAHVVFEGQFSDKMPSRTWSSRAPCLVGPNLFYEDARRAIHETGFEKIVYADDLNGFKEFAQNASVVSVLAEAKKCQTELHIWSRANQVSFDPAKESVHIVSHAQAYGDPFKLRGICFDCKLRMDLAVRDVVSQASWKLTTILRTRRFHGVSQLVQVYKSKVLSFVSTTPAVYHAAKTTLAGIDAVQRRFLRECGLSDEDALLHFNLAPLEPRRDIAMLGLIHRSVLGCGPRHFGNMCLPSPPSVSQKHDKQLSSQRSPRHLQILSRSALGLVDVYNLLPTGGWPEECGLNAARIADAFYNLERTPSLHVSLCMSTRCNCFLVFFVLWKLFVDLSNSEDLRHHAGGA